MQTGLIHLHNVLRWVILILLVVAVLRHLMGMMKKAPVTTGDKKVVKFLMISTHTNLLVGLVLYFIGNWGVKSFSTLGMGGVMKNAYARFFAVEHLIGMLIAVVLITIANAKVKRAKGSAIHKTAFLLLIIALIVILASIPWPFRGEIARPLFPGM
ncbi:hypothetical protein [Gynurincola endophyticus]|jgi:hypothetical protein|uniref:hypothetical protein n=1 Tax=Gynurincola endophyticus TaxID=2479004 RepID=UPI000F8D1470|nr:hypothetical protein [Gynurincola endophyticus]